MVLSSENAWRRVGWGRKGVVVGGDRAAAGSLCLLGCPLSMLLVWLHDCTLLSFPGLLACAWMGAVLLLVAVCLIYFFVCLPASFPG